LCQGKRGLSAAASGADLTQSSRQAHPSPRKHLKNNRPETIHIFGNFPESPKFKSNKKAEKIGFPKKNSTLWNSLASGVSLC
jgi:hypothetical protein